MDYNFLKHFPGSEKQQSITRRHHMTASKTAVSLLTLLCLAFAMVTPGSGRVLAQSETWVQVEPEQAAAEAGQAVTLKVQIISGVQVNAFDLALSYDPAVLSLEGYKTGAFLSNLAEVKKEDRPGYFHLVVTQLATPPVSGDGTLLELTFRTLAEGSTTVTLDSVQLAGSGETQQPLLCGGLVTVLPAVSPEPASTKTSAPPAATQVPPTATHPPTQAVTATVTSAPPAVTAAPTTAANPTALPTTAPAFTPTSEPESLPETARPAPTDEGSAPDAESEPEQADPQPDPSGSSVIALPVAGASMGSEAEEPEVVEPAAPPERPASSVILEGALWGVLIACVLLTPVLLISLARRRRHTEK